MQLKFMKIFLLVSYTCTQWVLNPESHFSPILVCEEEMPFMSKLIGTQPNEDVALLVQCPTYNI